MAVIVQVTVTDDETGEVKQTFAQTFSARDSWDAARVIRALMHRVFVAVFGSDDEWA